MADKRVISIRFHSDNKEDMELYERLEQEAASSASLASVVKAKIRDSYIAENQIVGITELQEQIVSTIRQEMQQSGMKMIGALLSGMNGTGGMVQTISITEESKLPEESGELPSGALDFLE